MAKARRKSKRKSSDKGTPTRVKLLVIVLVAISALGITTVKLLDTTRGRIFLLDAGLTDYYAQVQEEIEPDLRFAVRSLGLQRRLRVRVEREHVRGESVLVRHWQASCYEKCSPPQIGLEFARAAEAHGATAQSSVVPWRAGETTGQTVTIAVGSRRFPTHRITIKCFDAPPPPPVPHEQPPRLALVIDDFGYSKSKVVEAFLALDMPLTIAVIPTLPRTEYSLEQARAHGKQTILHVPMEAEHHASDVKTVATDMDDAEIHALLSRYLDSTPGVLGINNHMGSKATRDPRVMAAVVDELKGRHLFFLDSLTSPKSVAYNTAKNMDVPTAKNDLFLDYNTEDVLVVEERLLQLLDLARRKGSAVGIGHPKPWTYEAIKRNEEVLKESGVELVFVSELME